MAQDNKVISYVSPNEMAALMAETGMITVQENGVVDGKPVIHAALKVVNAQTGEQMPGGLPFSVVLFKNPREPGYSNIAIGAIVPAAELEISLPRDYFNFCNQRFRFTRVFPLDERSFVLQMDLFIHNATREYVKFMFGVWSAMFSQVLFELMGRGRESLVAAAEAYAARTDLAQHYVSMVTASDEAAADETAMAVPIEAELQPDPVLDPLPEAGDEQPGVETVMGEIKVEEVVAADAPLSDETSPQKAVAPEPDAEAAGEAIDAEPAVKPEEAEEAETVDDVVHVSPDIAAEGSKEKDFAAA